MRFRTCTIARVGALALTATVAACAAPSSQPVAASTPATSSSAAGFDGTYQGQSLADQVVSGCGEMSRAITIGVRGDHIWLHHGHPSLDGTIDPTGQVTMQNDDGTSSLTGSIQGDVLTGTETTSGAPRKLQGFYVNAQSTCTFAIQATRDR